MADNNKPTRITANIPDPLMPLIKRRMEDEKYPSFSTYILGLVIFDLYCRRKHKMTAPLMSEPPWVRDKVVEQIVSDFTNNQRHGRAEEPGWFEKRLDELIKERREQGEEGDQDKGSSDSPPKRPEK